MRTKIVASEFAAGLFPQNTLPGFIYCLDSGIDGIEFDVHLSADEHLIVHHDYFINPRIVRDAVGEWINTTIPPLSKLSISEIKQFDVGTYKPGSREEETYPDYTPMECQAIPTIDGFLVEYARRKSTATLWVELKTSPYQRDISSTPEALLRKAFEKVSQAGVLEHTVLLAFEWDLLALVKQINPIVATDFLH